MSLIKWVKSWLTHRGKALSLYRSGMVRAKKHDYAGAINDYSAAILVPDIPTDVKAMAIYNRAAAYSAIHEDAKAAADLSAVLAMPGAPERIRIEASRRRERIRRRDEKPENS